MLAHSLTCRLPLRHTYVQRLLRRPPGVSSLLVMTYPLLLLRLGRGAGDVTVQGLPLMVTELGREVARAPLLAQT